MAKLSRVNYKQFGLSGGTSNFGRFGSQAASAPVETKDPADIQSLSAWGNGWQDAVAAGQAPYLQDMNGQMYVEGYMTAYMFQEGVPEWDTATTYFIGSVVKKAGTFELYGSLIDTNLGNALPTRVDDSNWKYLGLMSGFVTQTKYRRPNIQYASGTTITIESGLDGTSGDVVVQYPDQVVYVTNNATLTTLDMTRVAVLSGGGKQSGLYTGTVASNTWYYSYSVKATDASSSIHVAHTVQPIQANFAALNSAFGTNGWRFLGRFRTGDNRNVTTAILPFFQNGSRTYLRNAETGGGVFNGAGIVMATSGGATSLTYTYSAGNTGTGIPSDIGLGMWQVARAAGSAGKNEVSDSGGTVGYAAGTAAVEYMVSFESIVTGGMKIASNNGSSVALDIWLYGWEDPVLAESSQSLL